MSSLFPKFNKTHKNAHVVFRSGYPLITI